MIYILKKFTSEGSYFMKKIGKFFNFLIAFALIVMAFLPFQRVDAVYDPGYDIVVTKMLVKDISQWATGGTLVTDGENAGYRRGLDSNTYYTGGKMTDQELTKYFGQNKVLKGVYFELRKDTKNGTIVKEGLTDDNGQIFFKGLQKGTYWLVENKEKSKLKDSDKKQLAGVAAVPMEIKLPVYKKDGSTFTTMDSNNALHVYPKNTIDEPSIEKKVNENDMKDTELIGQEKNYKITSIMPEGIEDYKRLEFTDKLSKGLTYAGGFNLKVHRGGTELPAINGKYDSNIPAEGTKNATINVKFKPEGIKLLKKGDKIVIKYKAKINEDAILGGANDNEVTLTYGTNPSELKEKKPEKPEIHTGGKRFKKTGENGAALAKAKFLIYNTDQTKVLKQTKNAGGKVVKNEWVAKATVDGKTAKEITDGNLATVFESNNNGEFEVVGLPYGKVNQPAASADSTTYYYKEIEAPAGYALLPGSAEFQVNATSYYKDPTQINLVPADPKVINNNKITIPQTGGIGSVIVVVGGVLLVGMGIFLKRRFSQQ